jgi:[ribosomal protein S5]-alanine N-acetyltransferase
MQIAETERLILREMTVEDAEDLHRIYSDAETMKFLGGKSASADERVQIEEHIENYYKKYGFGLWATILKENNRLVGRCGLLFQEIEGAKDLEIAYLFDRDYWGKGFAAEAAEMLVELGFERFGFQRIVAHIDPQNTASIRVAEKVGLKYEGEIPQFKDFGKVSLYSLEK